MWKNLRLFLIGMGMVVLSHQAAVAFAIDIPKLQARVTDLAGLLTPEQTASLEDKLKQFETSDSTQIAVLIIPSLEGEVLEDYSIRVATAWRLGQKGRDNGALLIIAMKERKVRIEVGYGLEPTLTDALGRRIIQNEVVPNFRAQQFYQGIDNGVTAIIQVVRGVYQASPRTSVGSDRTTGSRFRLDWLVFLLFPLLWLLGSTGKWGGGILGGGAGMYLIYSLLGFTLIPMLLVGLVGSVLGIFLGGLVQAGSRASSSSHRHWGGGGPFFPGGGGFSGGGFGGGGFGGGGFSGGGGGFGGGGSSGSW